MPHAPSELSVDEYRALRATIRERGTLRLLVIAVTFVAWAALLVAVAALLPIPLFTLVPLVALAGGFEAIYAAHVGVERIGRYVQLRYESSIDDAAPAWERTAMQMGGTGRASTGADPLASALFAGAAVLNFAPAVFAAFDQSADARVPIEIGVIALIHAVFIGRVLRGRRFASRQRAADLELMRQVLGGRTTE